MSEKLIDFKWPFNLYDFFGYFLPGFTFFSIIFIEYDLGDLLNYYTNNPISGKEFSLYGFQDHMVNLKFNYLFRFFSWNNGEEFKLSIILFFIAFCYLAGHVIAAFSSFWLERVFVEMITRYPSENLFGQQAFEGGKLQKTKEFFRKIAVRLFRNFCKPFDPDFINALEQKIKDRFGQQISKRREYFWLCFTEISQKSPIGYSRVMHFLNLYGFSRNMSMSFFLYIAIRIATHYFLLYNLRRDDLHVFNWLILFIYGIIGLTLFWNYTKLFRRQAQELFYHFYSI